MKQLRFPSWEQMFHAALEESNSAHKASKILLAQRVILERLGSIAFTPDTHEERQAILEALSSIRKIKNGLAPANGLDRARA